MLIDYVAVAATSCAVGASVIVAAEHIRNGRFHKRFNDMHRRSEPFQYPDRYTEIDYEGVQS
jgi:hypothetical protein